VAFACQEIYVIAMALVGMELVAKHPYAIHLVLMEEIASIQMHADALEIILDRFVKSQIVLEAAVLELALVLIIALVLQVNGLG